MFKLAVLGPLVTRGIGVAQECIKCRAHAGNYEQVCSGFGAGCLRLERDEPAAPRDDADCATAPIFKTK